jgi:hypothetical protein
MALRKEGKYWYGESQLDIRLELRRYSHDNSYPAIHFADAVCSCGERVFHLNIAEDEGVAIRRCKQCGSEHPMGDSDEYLEEAEPEECECPCGNDTFEVTAGVALYEGSEDVRWFYVGCRCPHCGLTACYGDWKNEYIGYKGLLSRV